MKRGDPSGILAALALALCWGVVTKAGAADDSTTRSAPPASGASRAAPVPRPATAPQGKPDYAIALNTQQEFKNTALAWTFRVENKGNAAPQGHKPTIKTPAGNYTNPMSGVAAADLVISVGQPCPQTTFWKPLARISVPVLEPRASVVLPASLYKMPDEYAGKGCRFRAEIQGPDADANASNNVMHMITKTAMLPDLVVRPAQVSGGPGGALEVANVGSGPAGPSKFRYECQSTDKTKSCGLPSQAWKGSEMLEVGVPALQPGKSQLVRSSTPKGATWKATADHANEVAEGNEGNNTFTSGK
jgi:hypothetical protein